MSNNERDVLSGVQCVVVDCEHHCGCGNCNAKEIKVGPTNAHQCTETICATFKKKSK